MTRVSSKNIGSLTQRRRCPCGDDQCYIQFNNELLENNILTNNNNNNNNNLTNSNATNLIEGSLPVDPNPNPSPNPNPNSDLTTVESPYVGQTFQTADEAQEYYMDFARNNGFAIRTERSKGNPNHPLGVYKRELVCHRAGMYRPRKLVELKRQRNKKSNRCKCEAGMVIKKNISKGMSKWLVVQFNNIHNHELLDSEEVRNLPAYRNICSMDRERVLALAKTGCTVNVIMRALETERGVKPGFLTFNERDLRNFLQASRSINRENDGLELVRVCKEMRERNPNFRYECSVDCNDRLEHVCWSYPECIRSYELFGDALVLDTTYRLYTYDRPVGVWFGMDNYGNALFFGCVLLLDERPESFRWALQSFVRLMDGKCPQTIITDLDASLKEAVMSELPSTRHAFSLHYILSKLPSWFSVQLGTNFDPFVHEFQRVCNLDVLEEFTDQWGKLVNEFNLASDRHIALLMYNRDYWTLPFLKGWFLGGLLGDASEFFASIKNFFKGFLSSQIHLCDFVDQVAIAVELQNQAGEESAMKQNYRNPNLRTRMPIEVHASTILTPYSFDLFQRELVQSVQFAVYETHRDTYLVKHRSEPPDRTGLGLGLGHVVQCNNSSNCALDEILRCSCKGFESTGIICRHTLRVLSLKNCFSLPDRYLPARWRRESSPYPKSTGYKYRMQALRSLLSIIIQESCVTKERFSHVQWHMTNLLSHVRDMPSISTTSSSGTDDCGPASSVGETAGGVRSRGRLSKGKEMEIQEMETETEMREVELNDSEQDLWEANELFGTQDLP